MDESIIITNPYMPLNDYNKPKNKHIFANIFYIITLIILTLLLLLNIAFFLFFIYSMNYFRDEFDNLRIFR